MNPKTNLFQVFATDKQQLPLKRQQSIKESLQYCCNCLCPNCVLIRIPNVENKIVDKIVVTM